MTGKLWLRAGLTLSFILSLTGRARADVTLAKVGDGWEFYTSGRIGAFVQVLKGDGRPQAFDAMGNAIHPVGDGGRVESSRTLKPWNVERSRRRRLAI